MDSNNPNYSQDNISGQESNPAADLPFQAAGDTSSGGGQPGAAAQDGSQAQGGSGNASLGGLLPQIGQWMESYQSGNAGQVPHDQLHQAFNQWAQSADPQQVRQATTKAYQQVPQQEHAGIAGALLDLFQQHGLNPQDAGVQTTNPGQMGPQDLSRLTSYVQQQRPGAMGQILQPGGLLSNPMVGMALSAALSYGLGRMMQGQGSRTGGQGQGPWQ
jgi:hypothetical protein